MRGRPGRAQGALKPGSASYAEARNASGSYLRQAGCVFFSPRPSSPGQGSGGTAPERHLTPAAVFISLGPRILTKGVGDPRRSGTSPLRYVICVSWMDRQGDYFEYDIYIYYPNPARGSTPPARGSTRAPARARRHPIHRETVPVAHAPESALRRPFARAVSDRLSVHAASERTVQLRNEVATGLAGIEQFRTERDGGVGDAVVRIDSQLRSDLLLSKPPSNATNSVPSLLSLIPDISSGSVLLPILKA
jgi:hypothetical protein